LTDPTGIIATNDIDALLALEPDCVLYMVNAIPEVCRQGPGLVSTLDLPYTPSTNLIR
jgi:hypothetical protein